MSNLYLTATSDTRKTEVTFRGNKELDVHLRTWTHGVEIFTSIDITGKPYFRIYRTGGSSEPGLSQWIADVTLEGITR